MSSKLLCVEACLGGALAPKSSIEGEAESVENPLNRSNCAVCGAVRDLAMVCAFGASVSDSEAESLRKQTWKKMRPNCAAVSRVAFRKN